MRAEKAALMTTVGIMLVSVLAFSGHQTVAQERREADLKKELFLPEYDPFEEGGDFFPEEHGEDADLPPGGMAIPGTDDLPRGMTEEDWRPVTQSDIKLMLPRLAKDLESRLFKKKNIFWPTWDVHKSQILVVSQYYDFAILLNNQNKDVDKIGARIEYSARTFDDVGMKVNAFGLIRINDIDTYYYNMDILHIEGFGTFEDAYLNHLKTAIHEAAHILAQTEDTRTADQMLLGSAVRGVTYPIDIESRYFRNEVFYQLEAALLTKSKKDKVQAVRRALYFHQAYLSVKPDNKSHDDYDYAEGMAEYIDTAVVNLIQNPGLKREELIETTGQSILQTTSFSEYDSGPGSRVIDWGREYYTLGAMAYAVAIQLGHDDIYASTISPFTFLLGKYDPSEIPANQQVKEDVYAYYTGVEQKFLAQKEEINRVLNHKDNVLLKIETKGNEEESMSILNDNLLLDHDGRQVSFEIREQEIRFGDHRIKITQKGLLSLTAGLPEDDLEDRFMEYSDGEEYDESHFQDDSISGTLIIPVHKNDVEFSDGKITIQTESLVLFDIKYKREGKYLILLRG